MWLQCVHLMAFYSEFVSLGSLQLRLQGFPDHQQVSLSPRGRLGGAHADNNGS